MAKSRTLQQFSDDLKKQGATNLEKRLRGLMEALKTDAEGQSKEHYVRKSGLRVRTGSLLGSISGGALAKIEGIGLFVRAGGLDRHGRPLRYARIQEFGGTIVPVNGEWLVFKGSKGWVKVKRVTIPARPYLRPGLKAVSQRMPDDLRKIVKLSIVGM